MWHGGHGRTLILPAPLGPKRQNIWLWGTVRLRPSTALITFLIRLRPMGSFSVSATLMSKRMTIDRESEMRSLDGRSRRRDENEERRDETRLTNGRTCNGADGRRLIPTLVALARATPNTCTLSRDHGPQFRCQPLHCGLP